jgi:hypothetical protein
VHFSSKANCRSQNLSVLNLSHEAVSAHFLFFSAEARTPGGRLLHCLQ